MKKNPESFKFIGNGQQAKAMDGKQMRNDGFQMIAEGLQKGLSMPSSGVETRGYGQQVPSPSAPQRTFAPASGPKIPPLKK